MEQYYEQNDWNAPYEDYRDHSTMHHPPPQFQFNSFNIPRANLDASYPAVNNAPEFRSPMADSDYGDDSEVHQRKRRNPYRGPAPHRNPAPGPLGLTGPWQDGDNAPRAPTYNRRGRGGRGGFQRSSQGPPHNSHNQCPPPPLFGDSRPPYKDSPKSKKASPYNMTVNPMGKVDVAAAKQKLLESVLENKHMSLPKELLDKFSPLKCDLCNAKMNSTSMAKLHYSGKNHEKKARQYMNNLNGIDPNAAPAKKAKLESAPGAPVLITANLSLEEQSAAAAEIEKPVVVSSSAVIESQKMECLSCNVSFTNPVQASQHFMSKNHARKLKGLDPVNAKYYNMETGEWQAKPVPSLPEDESGRFGIGAEFKGPLAAPLELPVITRLPPEVNKSLKVYCDVCDCYTTSQEQMQNHLKGSKHQKKWNTKQKSQSNLPQGIFLEEPAPAPAAEPVAPSKDQKKAGKKAAAVSSDMANFRTPSGHFYCSVCNLSVNSESQFQSHSESKKHKSKLTSAKTGPQVSVKSEKFVPAVVKEEKNGVGSSFGLIPNESETPMVGNF